MNIETAYNSWAAQYDTNSNPTRDLDMVSTIETLKYYKFSNVLELGCGTGKNTKWLVQKADRIIGLDFSQEMLNVARQKIADDKVQFIKSDLNQEWNVENESVDLVTSSLTLEHISDLNHVFEQANQKLKNDGLFFISELHPYKQYNGSGARFVTKAGTVELEVYTHHITDYVNSALKNGFAPVEMKEWFDERENRQTPRLISFVFRKNTLGQKKI